MIAVHFITRDGEGRGLEGGGDAGVPRGERREGGGERWNNSVCVTATKALIEKWIALSVHFVQEQKFQLLGARVDVLLKSRGVEKTAAGRGRWR